MRARAAIPVIGVALALAAPAEAAVEKVVVRQGPLVMNPYEVRFTSKSTRSVPAPRLDGYLVRMRARVVDEAGTPIPVQRVMLHHIVYKTRGRPDPVCQGSESFYGTGEENQELRLPPGYGYRIRRRDRWMTGWMLMNHRAAPDRAYIEYTAWVETSRRLRGVRPYWVRATGCEHARDPIFNVPGGRRRGARFVKTESWTVPRSGRIVAGGSHVHGGALALRLSQPRCGNRTLLVSRPLYGLPDHPYYNVLPVLHEPGPVATGWLTSRRGFSVAKGERLRIASVYDAERPHVRVMGIWHLYVAPGGGGRRCERLPGDLEQTLPPVPHRASPPAVTVPLVGLDPSGQAVNIDRPPGPTVRRGRRAAVTVGDRSFSIRNMAIPAGASVTWRFRGSGLHDVTLANGPVGFGVPWRERGDVYTRRFSVPGTYRIFCSLHPIEMTQAIDVTRRVGPR